MNLRKVTMALAWMLLMGYGVISCDRQRVFDTYRAIPGDGWYADSVQLFSFDISDTALYHNLYLNVRNDRSYPFSNLWLFVSVLPPHGTPLTDTLQVVMAYPDGRWAGTGFSGIYTQQVLYRETVSFPFAGTYNIRVMHGMRPHTLKGITHIGLRVERSTARFSSPVQ